MHSCIAIIYICAVITSKTVAFTNYIHTTQQSSSKDHNFCLSSSSNEERVIGVVAPLKYVGRYACLELNFPHLTSKTLNFVLDTGASITSISSKVAAQLQLPIIRKKEDLELLGTAGAAGSFEAGDIVLLGNCTLGGMPADYNQKFMCNMTAASIDLGIATKVCVGLLGVPFFSSFGAVEFDWWGTDGDPPTIQFYYSKVLPDFALKNKIPLEESFFGIPQITININGHYLRAVIDTGSPITIMSIEAAEIIGMDDQSLSRDEQKETSIEIKGIGDDSVNLLQTTCDFSIGTIKLENLLVCVGDLPGIAMASEMSSVPCPQVLLGQDVLRRTTYRMILSLQTNEVWFEQMPEKINNNKLK